MDVFSEALNAHVVSEADDAADGEDVFSVDLANDRLALSIDDPSEFAGGVYVGLHFRPLVMLGCDEGAYIDVKGVHWWSADGHVSCAVRAGWVEKEGVVGDYLAEGDLDEEDLCGWVDDLS